MSPDKALFSILARRANENPARPPGGKEKTEPLTRDLKSRTCLACWKGIGEDEVGAEEFD
jgi:hypothetical protein